MLGNDKAVAQRGYPATLPSGHDDELIGPPRPFHGGAKVQVARMAWFLRFRQGRDVNAGHAVLFGTACNCHLGAHRQPFPAQALALKAHLGDLGDVRGLGVDGRPVGARIHRGDDVLAGLLIEVDPHPPPVER